jgi:hypothetical protein
MPKSRAIRGSSESQMRSAAPLKNAAHASSRTVRPVWGAAAEDEGVVVSAEVKSAIVTAIATADEKRPHGAALG